MIRDDNVNTCDWNACLDKPPDRFRNPPLNGLYQTKPSFRFDLGEKLIQQLGGFNFYWRTFSRTTVMRVNRIMPVNRVRNPSMPAATETKARFVITRPQC